MYKTYLITVFFFHPRNYFLEQKKRSKQLESITLLDTFLVKLNSSRIKAELVVDLRLTTRRSPLHCPWQFLCLTPFCRFDGLLRSSPRPAGESYGSLMTYILGKICSSILLQTSTKLHESNQRVPSISVGNMISRTYSIQVFCPKTKTLVLLKT